MKMSWIVWLGILTMAALILAAGLGASLEFGAEVMIAFGLLMDIYVGGDQFAAAMRTRQLPPGDKHRGNRQKLVAIVLATFGLTLESLILQVVAARSGGTVTLPSMALFMVFLVGATALTAGEKIKIAVQDSGPKPDETTQ